VPIEQVRQLQTDEKALQDRALAEKAKQAVAYGPQGRQAASRAEAVAG
jgi:hypothetical protein